MLFRSPQASGVEGKIRIGSVGLRSVVKGPLKRSWIAGAGALECSGLSNTGIGKIKRRDRCSNDVDGFFCSCGAAIIGRYRKIHLKNASCIINHRGWIWSVESYSIVKVPCKLSGIAYIGLGELYFGRIACSADVTGDVCGRCWKYHQSVADGITATVGRDGIKNPAKDGLGSWRGKCEVDIA